jgi:hypothetical protein
VDGSPGAGQQTSIAIGSDGLGLIAYYVAGTGDLRVAHCSNPACTAATIATLDSTGDVGGGPSLAIGSDGLGLIVYHYVDGPFSTSKTAHCSDLLCSRADIFTQGLSETFTRVVIGSDGLGLLVGFGEGPGDGGQVGHCSDLICQVFVGGTAGGIELGPDGRALIVSSFGIPPATLVQHCSDALCSETSYSFLPGITEAGELGIGSDGHGLFRLSGGPSWQVAHCWDADCSMISVTTQLSTDRGSLTIGTDGLGLMTHELPTLRLGHCEDSACDTETLSGVIDVHPIDGSSVQVGPDGLALVSYRSETGLKVAHCSMTSCDVAGPYVSISDATVVEGNSGTAFAHLTVSLSQTAAVPVIVSWSTEDGGAQAGADYVAASGSLSFSPGESTQQVTVQVLADRVVEIDEQFRVHLADATNAVIVDQDGRITILDDDAPASPNELVHGSELHSKPLPTPGPLEESYSIQQPPYSSWEIVVDGASGGVAPLVVERITSPPTAPPQRGVSIMGGSSISLRWSNELAVPVANQPITVLGGGCHSTCDASASYRIRAYETTSRIPRFNNSETQTTVVILHNLGSYAAHGALWFWSASGALLHSEGFSVGPLTSYTLNCATRPALGGASGSITVTWDGRYGDLQGKAVAIEPATGFTFDSELTSRPR